MFQKPYFKTLSVIFPVYLSIFRNNFNRDKEGLKNIDYDDPLISQILSLIEAIFGIKLKNIESKVREEEEDVENDEDSKEVDNSEEEK